MLLNCCLTAGTVGVRVRRDIHARSDHEGGRLRVRLSPRRIPSQRLERPGLRHCHCRVSHAARTEIKSM